MNIMIKLLVIMAHMFDVLARVNGYLNNLSSYFDGNINLRHLPSTPKFITACIKRAINSHPDLIVEKSLDSSDYSISLVSVIDTGDIFTPIYVCTMPGLNYPIVDKVPVYVAKNDVSGPGKAYVILVTNAIFEGELDIPDNHHLDNTEVAS